MTDYENLLSLVNDTKRALGKEIDYGTLQKEGIIMKSEIKNKWIVLDWSKLPPDVISKTVSIDTGTNEVEFIDPKKIRNIR